MRLVVDTNILIAALIRDSGIRDLLTHLDAELFLISFSYDEIKHQNELLQKAHLNEASFKAILWQLTRKCVILDDKFILPHWEEAKKIMWEIDPKDTPFIAAALATDADIWNDDAHFSKQNTIKVWTTSELMQK